uniref:Integrase catalytic domain-containing protein n=1 Tax=Anopheles arabiensis TaxID=7173 RepID=A0A182I0X7_ANOAR
MEQKVDQKIQEMLQSDVIEKVEGPADWISPMVATETDWRKAVEDYVYMYNTTPHFVTEKAPLELLTGRPVKDLLPSLRTDPHWHRDEEVRDKDAIKKMQGKHYADVRRHAKPSNINVGDSVMLRNFETGKLEPKFKLQKFTVLEKKGNDTIVANEEGVRYRRSITHLRKFPSQFENDIPPSKIPRPQQNNPEKPLTSDKPKPLAPKREQKFNHVLKHPVKRL